MSAGYASIVASGPVVETAFGKIRGEQRSGCCRYFGIPFAKPPVGDLAFKAPVDPDPWTDVKNAVTLSKNPLQARRNYNPRAYGQDCLYLNVWVPQHGDDEKLPVMVWIFGGSYATGGVGRDASNPKTTLYDMERFCVETRTIVVTINYRLNLYGFLNLSFLNSEFQTNIGILDQMKALEWVSKNIKGFGGDPDNVTIFGQSAGGACVMALMSIPEARAYFQRGIAQSPCIDSFYTLDESYGIALMYLEELGIDYHDVELVKYLAPQDVIRANLAIRDRRWNAGDFRCVFSPAVDGQILRGFPKELAGKCGMPIVVGKNANEGSIFTRTTSPSDLRRMFEAGGIEYEKYDGNIWDKCGHALSETIYERPLSEFLSGCDQSSTYVYDFDMPIPLLRLFGVEDCHMTELPVLLQMDRYRGVYLGNMDSVPRVGGAMRRYWAGFAKDGAPDISDGAESSTWPSYAKGGYVKRFR